MPIMLRQVALCCLLTLTLAQNFPSFVRRFGSKPCASRCRFRFCVDTSKVVLTAPGNVSGPQICRDGQEIDKILTTGEVMVAAGTRKIPISKWMPDGLDPPFQPDVFKTATIFGEENSGIQRTDMRGNQNTFLPDRCFVLPVTKYERVKRGRNNKKRILMVNARSRNRDCIAFIPRVYDILFEVQWLSGDDLDISVVEPDGTLVDFENKSSGCGKHIGDGGVNTCEFKSQAIERVGYTRNCSRLQTGTYTIQVRHSTNCLLQTPPKPTQYEARVLVDGIVQRKIIGFTNGDKGQLATSFIYTI